MEQFFLLPAYVFNKSLNTQSITKQYKLPKYEAEWNHICQIDPFKN